MFEELWPAFALVLIIEGLLPALMPQRWRETMRSLSEADPGVIRIVGVVSMLAGAFLLHLMG